MSPQNRSEMLLKSITYKEYEKDPRQWILNKFDLNQINLIVGKNASGKTRTMNVISGLARIISEPKLTINNGYYLACFENGIGKIEYEIRLKNGAVTKEKLTIDGEPYLDRSMHGKGKMKNVLVNKMLEFKIPSDELAITRRDSVQYPFLEKLFNWGEQLRHFRFNTKLGKDSLAIINSALKPIDYNLKETDRLIELFRNGERELGQAFKQAIISDFNRVGYNITDVKTDELTSVRIETNLADKVIGIVVQESDREGYTDQNAMSMGMYRALSIIIHFNYYQLKKKSGTVLIDDIGEGLDFERSTNLIQLLIEKAPLSNIQLIMSSNDRFVMNNTDLEYWHLINRNGSIVNLLNHINSAKIFDEFSFTGLSNFDFFSSDFFKEGFEK